MLFNLPLSAIASGEPPTSLPQRNLLRHVTWSLPSGQSIARLLRVPALWGADFPELKSFRLGLEDSTPVSDVRAGARARPRSGRPPRLARLDGASDGRRRAPV